MINILERGELKAFKKNVDGESDRTPTKLEEKEEKQTIREGKGGMKNGLPESDVCSRQCLQQIGLLNLKPSYISSEIDYGFRDRIHPSPVRRL